MSETERKTEENESSSDEEPPPGELDKPIVILYNKRAKKVRYQSKVIYIRRNKDTGEVAKTAFEFFCFF